MQHNDDRANLIISMISPSSMQYSEPKRMALRWVAIHVDDQQTGSK